MQLLLTHKIGRWNVLRKEKYGQYWCQCECGRFFSVAHRRIITGKSKQCRYCANLITSKNRWKKIPKKDGGRIKFICSCGRICNTTQKKINDGALIECFICRNKRICIRHGYHGTKIYKVWSSMKSRCLNPNDKRYRWYGERGITVCERWNNFLNFLEDMGIPEDGMELDRIDNNKGYSKENCRWVSHKVNSNNRRPYPAKRNFFPRKHTAENLKTYIGKQYGSWTVLSPIHHQYNQPKMLCKCVCGNERTIFLNTLLKGTSSRCLNCNALANAKKRQKYTENDFINGRRFGCWTSLGVFKTKFRLLNILCRCDCGNEIYIDAKRLTAKEHKKCSLCKKVTDQKIN